MTSIFLTVDLRVPTHQPHQEIFSSSLSGLSYVFYVFSVERRARQRFRRRTHQALFLQTRFCVDSFFPPSPLPPVPSRGPCHPHTIPGCHGSLLHCHPPPLRLPTKKLFFSRGSATSRDSTFLPLDPFSPTKDFLSQSSPPPEFQPGSWLYSISPLVSAALTWRSYDPGSTPQPALKRNTHCLF